MNRSDKEAMKKSYEATCKAYVNAMLKSFDVDMENCFWVSDEIGGVFAVCDLLFLNMQEIVYVVENDISYDECIAWQDYNAMASEFNFNHINLKSWHIGAPRVSQETFDRLRKMKKEIEDLCEETRNKF